MALNSTGYNEGSNEGEIDMNTYELVKTPIWSMETLACLIDGESKREESFIQESEKFGMTTQEMELLLAPIILYKRKVYEEILPIALKYKKVMKYSKETEIEKVTMSEFLTLVVKNSECFDKEQTREEIDEIFNRHFTSLVNEYLSDENAGGAVVNSIVDIVSYFSMFKLDADFKMQMIELYTERYEVWEELRKFLSEAEGSCKAHFNIIEKQYLEAVNQLERENELEEILQKSDVLTMKFNKVTKVIPFIFIYNSLTLHEYDEENDSIYCIIGIFTLLFIERKKNNTMNDKHLITDLKAIGDETRLRILRLLTEQKMYNQELAEALNLTSATVSHHMNVLLQSRLISIALDTEKTKKVMYEINKQRLEELGDAIKSIG